MRKLIGAITFVIMIYQMPIMAQGLIFAGSYDSLANGVSAAFDGNIYVADQILGMVILNKDNFPESSYVSRFPIGGRPYDIEVAGNHAFITTASAEPYSGNLFAVDITDKANPFLAGELSFGTYGSYGMIIAQPGKAYIANGDAGVRFVWIGVPEDLYLTNTFDTPGFAMDVAIKKNYLYVADGQDGILIIDISDTADPVLVGSCDTPGFARDIEIDDIGRFYAFVDDDSAGIQIIDIANLAHPFIAANYPVPNTADNFKAYGSFLHMAVENELVLISVVDPLNPEVLLSSESPSQINGICRVGNYIITIGGESVSLFLNSLHSCHYVPGDINGNGSFNGIDVSYAVNYFKGGNVPPYSCECNPHGTFYTAGDINGNCIFNGLDITYMVRYIWPAEMKLSPATIVCRTKLYLT